MKLAVFNPVLYSMTLEESLKYLKSIGVSAMELGCGGSPGTTHANAVELAKTPAKLNDLKALFEKYEVTVTALSVHGNGIHPDRRIADAATADFDAACRIADKLNVDRVVTFSGCAGDKTSTYPNWITCTWPSEYTELLEWQWNEKLIPYWKQQGKVAADAGVKVCFEMHPGFMVYNTSTLLRLRGAVGGVLGANLDPSHLLWQGMDIVTVIHALGDAIYHFHAKDTMFNADRRAQNGVLDTTSYRKERDRAWLFRTVGYGACDWKAVITALRMAGYDHAVSIEHEDSLMTPKEGLEKAVAYLKGILILDSAKTEAWWV